MATPLDLPLAAAEAGAMPCVTDGADPRVVGVIVAGGDARRLGGLKALRPVAGRPIVARLIERIGPQCARLVINANGEAHPFAPFGLPVLPDHREDAGCGPLAGVLAGLDWAAANDPAADLVLSVPGDTPFLPEDLVARLHGRRVAEGACIAAARSGGRDHPLVALWPVALRDGLRRLVRERSLRRVGAAIGHWRVAWAEWPATPLDPFFNVNTPADLAAATRRAEARPP